jgi:hypothetical protein
LELSGDDPAEALGVLGARFARLGQARPDVFRRELHARVTAREATRIAQLRGNASDDAAAFYQALQKRYTDVVQDAVTHEDFLLPRDLPGEPLTLTQSLVGRMGAMLSAWPRLWNAALWMRTNGSRLSRLLG